MTTASNYISAFLLLLFLALQHTATAQHINPKTIYYFGGSHFPGSVALSDIDRDGDLDVISHNKFENKPVIYASNSGNGSFSIYNIAGSDKLGSIGFLTVSDLDKNGYSDIIAVTCNSYEKNKIVVWFGQGANSFSSPIVLIQNLNTSSESSNNKIHVVDINQDGLLDILLPQMTVDYKMTWIKNNGGYGGWQQFILNNVELVSQSAVADLNGDGILEIISCGYSVNVHYGQDWSLKKEISTKSFEETGLFTADFDNDGDLDIIAGTVKWSDGLVWYENLGNLTFTERLIENSKGSFSSILVNDFNQDGLPDILASCYTTCPYTYFMNVGNGKFTKTIYEPYTAAIDNRYGMALGDLDGDGKKDLVVADAREHAVRWYKSNFDLVLGVEDKPLEAGIKATPNPTSGIIQISSEKEFITNVKVYNINGSKMYEESFSLMSRQVRLDLSSSQRGMYVVAVTLNNGMTMKQKVIKE